MLKKVAILLISGAFLLMVSCSNQTEKDNRTTLNSQETVTMLETNTVTQTQTDDTQTTTEDVAPVGNITDGARVIYGENTGTDKTYTGLEPLPLTQFSTARFADENISRALREHSYGVASDETAHDISINNQKFFDNGNYDSICLDTTTTQKVLYLTFDCGYENGYTAKILDVLKEKNVPAAFFCTKPEMVENPQIIARMINEGHIVGNHSVTHPDFSTLSRGEMFDEVKGFDDYIREHFGYSSLFFRFPQGKYSEDALSMLNSMGFKCVFWSLAYADWDLSNQKGADYALETVISRIHPGTVMLLHAVSPDNANALADIIDTARSMGYTFKALTDL